MSSKPKVEVPEWVADLLSGNLIAKMEYVGNEVVLRVNLRAFFEKVLEGTGIELVEVTDKHAVLRIPINLDI